MTADLVLKNGFVWTGSENRFVKRNLCVSKGIIVASPDKHAQDINVGNRWLVPGFTDCHVHLVNFAVALSRLRLDGLRLTAIQQQIESAAERTPAGGWIRGRGWEAACRVEGGFPDRNEVDHLTPDNPMALSSKDGHTIWLNTRALRELGIHSDVPDPPGGRYDRRSDGSLTGIIRETAADAVKAMLPPVSNAEKYRLLKNAFPRLHRQGIIAVHSFETLSEYNLLLEMDTRGELPLRVTASFNLEDLDRALTLGLKPGQGTAHVRLGGLKLYADGALGSRSAAMFEPYTGEPGNLGMEVMTPGALRDSAVRAARNGLPTAIHAIGDRAVHHALDALEAARIEAPGISGMRVEHIQMVQPDDLARFQRLNIAASIQPCHMLSDIEMAEKYWAEQTGMRYPYHSLAESGALCVLGSDAPIDDENPLRNIRGAVTRRRLSGRWSDRSWLPGERMRVYDALKGYTSHPGRLEGVPRGRLDPGYPADIVVLTGNPLKADPGTIHEIGIEAVFLSGNRLEYGE